MCILWILLGKGSGEREKLQLTCTRVYLKDCMGQLSNRKTRIIVLVKLACPKGDSHPSGQPRLLRSLDISCRARLCKTRTIGSCFRQFSL